MLLSESRVIFINQAASSFNRNVIATLSEIPLKGQGVRLEKGKKRRLRMHKIHTLSTNYVFRGEVEGMFHSFMQWRQIYSRQFDCAWV